MKKLSQKRGHVFQGIQSKRVLEVYSLLVREVKQHCEKGEALNGEDFDQELIIAIESVLEKYPRTFDDMNKEDKRQSALKMLLKELN